MRLLVKIRFKLIFGLNGCDLHQIRGAFCGKLPASGVNVAPARSANKSVNAFARENSLKTLNLLPRRRAIFERLGGIVRNQIDFNVPEIVSVNQICKLAGVFVRIVNVR